MISGTNHQADNDAGLTLPGTLPPSLANVLRNGPAPIDARSLGRTVVLAPHPDDESLGCGGTLALLRRAGFLVHVVFVSDGTQSHPNSATYPATRLRDLREAEALDALRELGVSDRDVTFMRLPDRQVPVTDSVGFAEAVNRLRAVLEDVEPTSILVPFERDPHPDHRATYQLMQGALAHLKEPPRVLEYLIWLWELGRPDDMPRTNERLAVSVDISSVVAEKKRAIAAHRSQVTRMIDDDPSAFYLSPELLRHFDTPYELFLEKPLSA
ncbi:PIG-L deacetylase family protein [Fibrivirga algicola]|uniref:PIG-L family deacetylase n=1 Tax=Fibrivirga algicola TaxID=2950420 RepID=A0ABX0QR14_9BACT|nr:PIG-L deacetylase family protein [Fibrivirga algicola]NID13008.1 PIG-L family deacetylase [Fibrivirga algicola]